MREFRRAFQFSVALCIAFLLALIVTLRISILQRKTISTLRSEAVSRDLREPPETGLSKVPEAQRVPFPVPIPERPLAQPILSIPPDQTPSRPDVPGRVETENAKLAKELREASADLAKAKHQLPEPDDPTRAYFGPGTWINVDPQSRGIQKIVIVGDTDNQSIRAWGRCSPADCDWGEVQLFLLRVDDPSQEYHRGFATWQFPGGEQNHVILTFEKAGLRLEMIHLTGSRVVPYRRAEKMIRIY
jgi:hypothetical protein